LKYLILLICFAACKSKENSIASPESKEIRREISFNSDWQTVFADSLSLSDEEILNNPEAVQDWQNVEIPHNWDQYQGFRRMVHGNLHGTAWYRKKFMVSPGEKDKKHFLFFEGVGSYATVWVNGEKVGGHKGGRTTFTLDISEALD